MVPTVVRDVYRDRFNAAHRDLRVELRLVTPEWAKAVLAEHNKKNRRLSASWLKIRAAIDRDAWQVNGEAIVFDRDGNLVDGQHRLTAIAESGVAVPVIIVYGVGPDAFPTKDQGKKRNAGDVLSVEGHESATVLAGALAWQQRYESGDIDNVHHRSVPNDQVISLVVGHPELISSVSWANQHRNRLIPPSLLAFIHYQFNGLDPEQTEAFFAKVADGVGVEKDSHEFLLRRRLEGVVGQRDNVTQLEICALVFKTWSRVRLAEPVGKLLTWNRSTEPFPVIV